MDYPTVYKHLFKFKLNIPLSTIWQKLKDKPLQFQTTLQDIQNAKYIGIDEFSYAKGHSYGVIAVNIDKHKIADMVAGGRDQLTAEAALSVFNPATVQACCIDMHEPFKLACHNKFPNADVVVDRFHVIKLLNEAIKDLIKRILPESCPDHAQQKEFNKSGKWIILSAKEKLTDFQRPKLPELLALDPELKTIYEFKESFRNIYRKTIDYDLAHEQFHSWLNLAKSSGISELIGVADTYSHWLTFILNYWHHRISNGITEGKVNKIKVFRRKAYHFKNFHSLRYQVMKSEQFNFRK
jgi:transposase